MYEGMTQETILETMIAEASEEVSVIEGSFLYNALSLAAVALEDAYDDAEALLQNAFPDTCDREHLLRMAQTKQMVPYPATAARYVVSCNVPLEADAMLTDGTRSYLVTEGGTTAVVDCADTGAEGNGLAAGTELGTVDYVEGFARCTVLRQLSAGEDAEETEAFRTRYLDAMQAVGMYGNQKTYEELLRENGVTGKTLVTAAGTTVSISYLNEDGTIPAQEDFDRVILAIWDAAPLGRSMQGVYPTVTEKTATLGALALADENGDAAAARTRVAEILNDYFQALCVAHFDSAVDLWPATLTAAVMDALTPADGIEMVNFSAIAGSSGKVTKPAGALWTQWTVVSA